MYCVKSFFSYTTNKSVVVKSWTVGIINRLVQLLIISYFVGWVFLHERAYQVHDMAIESSVMTKVKGFGLRGSTVMDIPDLVSPAESSSVFCITTSLVTTKNQVQTVCPKTDLRFKCDRDADCEKRMGSPGESAMITGRCVQLNDTIKTCELKGWCPDEVDNVDIHPIENVENFTIFIKNSIRFPRFNFTKGNFLPNITEAYIKKCHFDIQDDIYCPIFRVGDVLRYANQNFSKVASEGAVIGIKIGWVCNLDLSEEHCRPSYTFTRLDTASQRNNVSPGYNFRYSKYYKWENGTEYRTLHKAFAIRFDVLVHGNAGKFNMIPTVINIVAAFTSVGLGTVLCDIILLNFLKGADHYKAKKFEEVEEANLVSVSYHSTIQTPEEKEFDSGLSNGERGHLR